MLDAPKSKGDVKVEYAWGDIQLCWIWETILSFPTKALVKKISTARNNPLVWWVAILVRSTISGEEDFISSGRFNKNPMPIDLDMGGLGAMVHYSKVFVLDYAFNT